MNYIFVFLLFYCSVCYSQKNYSTAETKLPASTFYTSTLSTHPFGVFISRIHNNFQISTDKKISITASLSNGNIWLPYVKGYEPINQTDRDAIKKIVWHEREGNFDFVNTPSKVTEFHADGTIRSYFFDVNFPISKNQELKLKNRMVSFDEGRIPYTLFTSDQFIEWFHSHIAGGEDPFARKAYGFNHASFRYVDKNGKKMELNQGDFIFSGIDLSYYYYPMNNFLKKKSIYLNIGIQTGFNLIKYNPSLDLGLNTTLTKRIAFSDKAKTLIVATSLGVLHQKLFQFDKTVQFSNAKYIFSNELLLEYIKFFDEHRYFSIATTWYLQSSFNNKKEYEYLVLTGNRVSTHWNYALSHLHRKLSANSLVFSFGFKELVFWFYLREDLLVDNAPDAQTGIGIKYFIHKNCTN